MNQPEAERLREDSCIYCGGEGTDHSHGGGRAHGDCCGMHGAILHDSGKDAHKWVIECYEGKNARIDALQAKLAAVEKERDEFHTDATREMHRAIAAERALGDVLQPKPPSLTPQEGKPFLAWEYRGEGLYIIWANPFREFQKEDVAMFMWPSHDQKDTEAVEAQYESFAKAFVEAWNMDHWKQEMIDHYGSVQTLQATVTRLQAELNCSEEAINALTATYEGCPHHPIGDAGGCGCSYDKIGDVCALHAPALQRLQAEVELCHKLGIAEDTSGALYNRELADYKVQHSAEVAEARRKALEDAYAVISDEADPKLQDVVDAIRQLIRALQDAKETQP